MLEESERRMTEARAMDVDVDSAEGDSTGLHLSGALSADGVGLGGFSGLHSGLQAVSGHDARAPLRARAGTAKVANETECECS